MSYSFSTFVLIQVLAFLTEIKFITKCGLVIQFEILYFFIVRRVLIMLTNSKKYLLGLNYHLI